MGKRSNFERRSQDFYRTPYEAVVPLLPYLPPKTRFIEPCAGDGVLIEHLEKHGHECVWSWDIEPKAADIDKADALTVSAGGVRFDFYITNPPWTRTILHPLITHLSSQKPTWLLFDADWMHTKQAEPYLRYCLQIVSIGRVRWIEDSKYTGKDNSCWYLFDRDEVVATGFAGRRAA